MPKEVADRLMVEVWTHLLNDYVFRPPWYKRAWRRLTRTAYRPTHRRSTHD